MRASLISQSMRGMRSMRSMGWGDASESGQEQLCVLVEYHKARSSLISQSMRGMRSMRSMRGARVLCLILKYYKYAWYAKYAKYVRGEGYA